MTFSDLGIQEKSGQSRYYTLCPQCNHLRKKHKDVACLTVNDEVGNRWYKCHHCGWSGNLDLQDKFKEVSEHSRMPKLIPDTYSKEVRDYLQKRGISAKTAKREMVFEYSVGRGGPIMGFPFYINKTLVNVKYFNVRWTPESDSMKWWQMDRKLGAKAIFLGMQSIRFERDEEIEQNKTIIITEGEWDWLTWKECGYNNTLSVPQGAPNPKIKHFTTEFEYMTDSYVTSFFHPDNVDLIIFSTDGDAPGEMLRNQLAMFLGRERCKYINYPAGYKDINEVYAGNEKKGLPALGQEGVDDCYRNLSSFQVAGVIKPSDIRGDLQKYAEKGFKPGLGCGLPFIDRLFTLKPKHITFVTGVPGCFTSDQLVHTNRGVIPISEIQENDKVLSYNHGRDINEYRNVLATHKYTSHPDKLYKITLKDGTVIKVTENHEFYTGVSYVQIKEILLYLKNKLKK